MSTTPGTKDSPEVVRVRGEIHKGLIALSVYYTTGKHGLFRVVLVRSGDGSGYELREWSEVEGVGGPALDTFDRHLVPPVVRGAVDCPVQVPPEQ